MVRNTNWYDLFSLYAHDTAIESTFDNELNFGVVLSQHGDMQGALKHLLIADREYPTEFTLQNTGLLYLILHDKVHSYEYLSKAYTAKSYVLPPHHHQTVTYDSYARWFMVYGDYQHANRILSRGIKDYPSEPTLWYLQAINNYFMKDKNQAILAAEKAYQLSPGENTKMLLDDLQKNIPLNIQLN
jgi:tetratricopeptide (TPR) repeat protein